MTHMLLNSELPAHVLCAQMADLLLKKQLKLVTAESCTGGMIAAACTDLAGSSAWFERGFVTYSNDAKTELLGVPTRLLARAGAVCEGVARAMVQGALAHSHAQVAVAVTGWPAPPGAARPNLWARCGLALPQGGRSSRKNACLKATAQPCAVPPCNTLSNDW